MYVFVSVYVHEIISKKSKTQNYARISQFVYVHEILKNKKTLSSSTLCLLMI